MSFFERHDIEPWGRVERRAQVVATPAFRDELPDLLADRGDRPSCLGVGLRRSYGDLCLNGEGALIDMTRLSRFIAFAPQTGVLRVEAGTSLSAILDLVVPHGWFLSTTPGTRFVTLGGAVANDVHGKNQHRAGTFGQNVRRIGLMRSDGRRLVLSETENPELFFATIGGLGLTGLIEWVEIALVAVPSAQLDVETVPFPSIDMFWELARDSIKSHEHTVAWLDCAAKGRAFGRGIFSRANWRPGSDRTKRQGASWASVPLEMPEALFNGWTVRAFNRAYFGLHRRATTAVHYAPYFYPLDAVGNWNRLYGRRGMYQYQCVVPVERQEQAVDGLLATIRESAERPYLVVLKTFGDIAPRGLLSFVREGATLSLDFPNRGSATRELMDRLDGVVRDAGGRLYPAKDARMSAEMFRSGYPGLARFAAHIDPACESDFWRRTTGGRRGLK